MYGQDINYVVIVFLSYGKKDFKTQCKSYTKKLLCGKIHLSVFYVINTKKLLAQILMEIKPLLKQLDT